MEFRIIRLFGNNDREIATLDVQQTVLYNWLIKKERGTMLAVNYTTLRSNMKHYFDKIADSFEPMIVTRKEENMVIMSQSTYDGIMETMYLMSDKENYDHLKRSISQFENAKQHDLVE